MRHSKAKAAQAKRAARNLDARGSGGKLKRREYEAALVKLQSQMYMQRYVSYLPAAGEVVIFDRSWYNRAGVERVMGFCTEDEARRFIDAAPPVEKAVVDSGVMLIKY